MPAMAALAAAWPAPDPRPARSKASVVLATAQPPLRSPMIASSPTRASVRNTSLNIARPVISRSGRTSMPGLVHVDREVRDALVLGHVGVGAGDQHPEVGDVTRRRPHLLPVDDPLVAVADGARLQPGEVAAGDRLAEQLAPRLAAGHDVGDVAVDLLAGAVRGDRRRGEQETEPAGRGERAVGGDRLGDAHGVVARHAAAVGLGRAAKVPTSPPCRAGPTTRRPSCPDPSWLSSQPFSSSIDARPREDHARRGQSANNSSRLPGRAGTGGSASSSAGTKAA